jgi:MoaA/NifB/PqqE/SkfB family radical SAM enzyme|tara:strand:+ start:144 stop:773 length:630 start_codon:yes stop_codon:yes gene_type:complete
MSFKKNSRLNLDVTHRCPLECPNCQRQTSFTNYGLVPHGRDLSVVEIDMIAKHFKEVAFCGQLSDPVHHPKFNDIMSQLKNVPEVFVHNAATAKPISWYIKSWQANPKAVWIFACDGLPKDSHKYRKNQDGVKMFEIMKEATKHLLSTPVWQCIRFSYNENDIETCKKMANNNGINFMLTESSRWLTNDDPLKPTKALISKNAVYEIKS